MSGTSEIRGGERPSGVARTAAEVAAAVGGELLSGDPECKLTCARPISAPHRDAVSFAEGKGALSGVDLAAAGCLLVPVSLVDQIPAGPAVIAVAEPRTAFARAARLFAVRRVAPPGRHPTALVDETAVVADDASVGPYSIVGARARVGRGVELAAGVHVGADVEIGDGCVLLDHVVVAAGVRIGARCLLHPGAVIGRDGFGFATRDEGERRVHERIPQLGTVVLGDDVEIGAHSCVDRATFGATVIGDGAKLDNLVQVGHNVVVGPGAIVAAQAGVAGSSRLGAGVRMGAQAGVADHVEVGPRAELLARAGVIADVARGLRVAGFPAVRAFSFFRQVRELGSLLRRVERIEEELRGRTCPSS